MASLALLTEHVPGHGAATRVKVCPVGFESCLAQILAYPSSLFSEYAYLFAFPTMENTHLMF